MTKIIIQETLKNLEQNRNSISKETYDSCKSFLNNSGHSSSDANSITKAIKFELSKLDFGEKSRDFINKEHCGWGDIIEKKLKNPSFKNSNEHRYLENVEEFWRSKLEKYDGSFDMTYLEQTKEFLIDNLSTIQEIISNF